LPLKICSSALSSMLIFHRFADFSVSREFLGHGLHLGQ